MFPLPPQTQFAAENGIPKGRCPFGAPRVGVGAGQSPAGVQGQSPAGVQGQSPCQGFGDSVPD